MSDKSYPTYEEWIYLGGRPKTQGFSCYRDLSIAAERSFKTQYETETRGAYEKAQQEIAARDARITELVAVVSEGAMGCCGHIKESLNQRIAELEAKLAKTEENAAYWQAITQGADALEALKP